jgi:hypothetical protein
METLPTDMVDEVAGKGSKDNHIADPNMLMDRRWLTAVSMEGIEDLVEVIRPVLLKSLGTTPLTVEEHALAQFFHEEALTDVDE